MEHRLLATIGVEVEELDLVLNFADGLLELGEDRVHTVGCWRKLRGLGGMLERSCQHQAPRSASVLEAALTRFRKQSPACLLSWGEFVWPGVERDRVLVQRG